MADPVWLLLFFDLPTTTKKYRRDANKYRNLLLDQGFDRIQLSVYAKYYVNATATNRDEKILTTNVPTEGVAQILKITNRQWHSKRRFEGKEEGQGEPAPDQLTIF